VLEFLVFAAIGKVIMYVWNIFPASLYLSNRLEFFRKLFGCDLCFGVWVYSFLALFVPESNPLIVFVDDWLYNPVLFSVIYVGIALIFGIITSFLVHIFSLGWNARFQVFVVE
jgi:hypothetical protein